MKVDINMFHINVEGWVKQDKGTATIFCAMAKHNFTDPFCRPCYVFENMYVL